MARITRTLSAEKETIIESGRFVKFGSLLKPLEKEIVQGCDETAFVPALSVLTNTGFVTVEGTDYFASIADIAYVISLLDKAPEPGPFYFPNAKHCKTINWQIEQIIISSDPEDEDVVIYIDGPLQGFDFIIFFGALFIRQFSTQTSLIKLQATLDGQSAGRELTITLP